jgi:hypothetical protein
MSAFLLVEFGLGIRRGGFVVLSISRLAVLGLKFSESEENSLISERDCQKYH